MVAELNIMNNELYERVKRSLWNLSEKLFYQYQHAHDGVYKTGIETILFETYKVELCVQLKGIQWELKYRFPEIFGMTQKIKWDKSNNEAELMRQLLESFDEVKQTILLQIECNEALPLQNPQKVYHNNLKKQQAHLAHHDGEKVILHLVGNPEWCGKDVIRCIFPDNTSAGIRKCDLYDCKEAALC